MEVEPPQVHPTQQEPPAPDAVEAEPEHMLLIVSRVMAGARWKREHTQQRRDELKQAAKAARVDEVSALDDLLCDACHGPLTLPPCRAGPQRFAKDRGS